MPPPLPENSNPNRMTRAFNPNDVNEAGFRILRELDSDGNTIEDVLIELGKREKDPGDFVLSVATHLIGQIRFDVSARGFSVGNELQSSAEISPTHGQLSQLSHMMEAQTKTPSLSTREISNVLSHVREKLQLQINQKRAQRGQFPL